MTITTLATDHCHGTDVLSDVISFNLLTGKSSLFRDGKRVSSSRLHGTDRAPTEPPSGHLTTLEAVTPYKLQNADVRPRYSGFAAVAVLL